MLGENMAKVEIQAGGVAVGVQMMFVNTAMIEYAGWAGFDFILMDGEHGPVLWRNRSS